MQAPYDTRQADGDPYPADPIELRGVADAGGICTVISSPVPAGFRWLVDYLTTVSDSDSGPAFSCYRDTAEIFNLIDGTTAGAGAVGVYAPPRVIAQGSVIVGVWVGCTPGAQCQLTIEYRVQAT